MDDDELYPHLWGLQKSVEIAIEENSPANVEGLTREIESTQEEIHRRGL